MTDRDEGTGEPSGQELRPPSDGVSPERRALADAIRDALTTRADVPERDGPPRRARAAPAAPSPAAADSALADPGPDDSARTDPAPDESARADTATPDTAPADDLPEDEAAPAFANPESDDRKRDADARIGPFADADDVSPQGIETGGIETDGVDNDRIDNDRIDNDRIDTDGTSTRTGDIGIDGDQSQSDPESDSDADSDPDPEADPAWEAPRTPPVTAATAAAPEEPSSLETPAPLDEQQKPRRFSTRGVVAVGARAVTGALGVLVAVLAIFAATAFPDPRITATPRALTVDPVPAAQQRVCPGPVLRLGDDEGQGATTASSIGRAGSVFQATPRDPDSEPLPETENTAGAAPQLLTLPPADSGDSARSAPALAGSQSQAVDSGDLVGLAAAECAEASGDSWLVGGSTDVGRTTLVTLSNPTTVTATVDLTIFGPTGEISAPGSRGIVVQPGVQRIFSLAGFAPQIPAPVVRVTSRGGLVVAHLQQTTVRTLEPGGIAMVGATRSPARRVVIPGIVISAASAITEAQGREGYADLQTTLRMFVPGVEATTATITITPEQGQDALEAGDSVAVEGGERGSTGFEVPLGAGEVTELPVPGLADGSYTVTIETDEPVVAAARTSTIGDAGSDFTWLPGGRALDETTLLSVAFGPSPVLHLVNPDADDRVVTLIGAKGDDETEIEVGAGESVDAALTAGQDVTLTGTSGLLATVTYAGDGRVAAFGVTAPGPASAPVTVYR